MVPGYDDALRADRVAAVGGVRLSFSGLHPDQYLVKTDHYQTSDNTPVDVCASEDGGFLGLAGLGIGRRRTLRGSQPASN